MFPEYDPETSEVSVGVCSTDAVLGLAEICNVKFLSEQDVASAETRQWNVYSEWDDAGPADDKCSFEEGYFEKTGTGWTTMPLYGSSKTWQVEGTMKRTDARDAEMLKMGFRIESGDKEIRLLGQNYGILPILSSGWPWVWGYNEGINDYVLNTKASGIFHTSEKLADDKWARTADEITFKAVIYEDVLYVWFDGDLCWRVPLTDHAFKLEDGSSYQFEPGSDYRLTLVLYDGSGLGKMTDLKVKMGYQVTEQKDFHQDEDGKEYSFTEALKRENAHVDAFLKEIKDGKTNNMMLSSWDGGRIPRTDIGGAAYSYGVDTLGNTGVEANVICKTGADENGNTTYPSAGVSVKVGEESVQFLIQAGNTQIRRQKGHGWNDVVWMNFPDTKLYGENDEGLLQAFVKDGYLYIFFNGTQVYCMNMVSLFHDYDADSQVSVGICSWDAYLGSVSFSDVKYLSAEDVLDANAEQWGYYSDNPGADSYSFEEGYFEKKNADGWKIMPLMGSSKTWQVEGTMKRTDARDAEMLKMGFRIESGDKEIRLLGQNYGILPIINNGWPWVWGYNEGTNDYVLNTKASSLFHERTADEITFKAVIYEDVLYVWFDGDLCWRVPLTNNQINGGYNFEPGSDYRLTLVLYDGSGLGKMTDLDVKMGYQVEAPVWTDVRNMTYDAAKNAYVVGEGAESYLYSKAAAGDIGVSADALLKGGNAGITVQVGKESWQFLTNEQEESVYMKNHQWDGNTRINKDFSVPLCGADGRGNIKGLVKDGYFYLLFNDKEVLCINMAALFPDYNKNSLVSMGFCGWWSSGVCFENVKYLSSEEVKAVDTTQWGYFSVDKGNASCDFENGVLERTENNENWTMVPLLGSSKSWRVEGTMEADGRLPLMGIGVKTGDKSFRILGAEYSFVAANFENTDWWNNALHPYWSPETNEYCLSNMTSSFFSDSASEGTNKINFVAVLKDDILDVSFNGVPCWHIPLTNAHSLLGFTPGSNYEFYLINGNSKTCKMTDLDVKMGYQVEDLNVGMDSRAMKQEQAASQTKQEKTALLQAAVLPGEEQREKRRKESRILLRRYYKGRVLGKAI